jgi:hypothetical protein
MILNETNQWGLNGSTMVGKTYLAASHGNIFAGARRRWAGMTASRESEGKTGYLCVIRLMHTSSKHHLMQSFTR